MKPIYIGIAAAMLALAVIALTACKGKQETDDIDGGVQHRVDTTAPKVIQSTEIVSFSCRCSLLTRSEEDTALAGNIYELQADATAGSYRVLVPGKTRVHQTFTPGKDFFVTLQKIVSENDLAQYNGEFYTVSGLPPEFGAKLNIRYASGESIQSSNNQSCFLSLKAVEELEALFRQACQNT